MTDPSDHPASMRRLFVWACAATWICEFVLTHIPADSLPPLGAGDKLLHGVAFFAISGTFVAAISVCKVPRRRRIMLTAVIMSIYAALDELSQPLTNRTASFDDWLADIVGAMIALVAVESVLAIRSALTANKKIDQSP